MTKLVQADIKTTSGRVCPRCEQQRMGYLRYCLDCGLDYDAPASTPSIVPEVEHVTRTKAIAPKLEAVIRTPSIAPDLPFGPPPAPPRRIGPYLVIGAAAVIALGALWSVTTTRPSSSPTAPPRSSAAAITIPTSAPAASVTFGPTGRTQVGVVSRIVDGDTIMAVVDGVDLPVRYIGMDTLEPNATEPLTKQLADAATAANAALVDGREVILERDISETDQFNRLLRNVWIKDDAGAFELVNLELVRLGFAQVATFPPDVKYVDLLTAAQEAARVAELGLWAPAPAPTPTPTPLGALFDPGNPSPGRIGVLDVNIGGRFMPASTTAAT